MKLPGTLEALIDALRVLPGVANSAAASAVVLGTACWMRDISQ